MTRVSLSDLLDELSLSDDHPPLDVLARWTNPDPRDFLAALGLGNSLGLLTLESGRVQLTAQGRYQIERGTQEHVRPMGVPA